MHFWQATRRIFILFRVPFCLLTTKKGHFWCSAPLEKCILRAFLSHFCPIFEHFCLIFALFCLIFALFCPFLMLFYVVLVFFPTILARFYAQTAPYQRASGGWGVV